VARGVWEPPQATTSESESATRATTRLLPVRAVRERPLGSLPPRALGICVPELEPDSELTRTMAIMISFKLGKRQNRGSRAPIMIDRVSRRSARVLLCLALVPRRLMCDLHVICKTWNRHTIPISSNHYIHMPRPFYLSCITAFGIFLPLCGGVFPLSRQVGG
jgi:hypothetical protein